jgi:hypothetical protein
LSSLHSKTFPDYITAGSPQGLRRLMYKTNAKFGANHQYFDISQYVDKKGKHRFIAWFFRDLNDLKELNGDD